MSKLLLRNHAPDAAGRVHHVTPQSAGWEHVGFDLYRLDPGQTVSGSDPGRESCLVFVSGKGDAMAGREEWSGLGERTSPFEDKRPYAIYVPQGAGWQVRATTALELAVCTAPGHGGGLPVRLIRPEDVAASVRGAGSNTRHVFDILPETKPADSLLVVEVVTPPGNWSSYPPHKHDLDDGTAETLLEETYYHRIDPPQGFAFQRVYTDDRSLDEAMAVEDGDLVMVPRGYHPVGVAHGYTGYYLNVMAGPRRAWHFNTAPEHRWLMRAS
ncbi:5-deoxy-glucuronate isomerase [Azospirillum thermophilum]|uniref:5-deoxy-glucuronate isomerase n=1 Tax=Azospirillum thermophilum TaxID=2202148 RepID=A0A2S2CZ99_9PROT|nr:5-deoxy-glucuronate isomerase [Azospirillum thermophilum]AWK89832.1 5-deoxy-glucuronate isomerase [Azospirillum thermophilum]